MNPRVNQPEPIPHWGYVVIEYHVNQYEVVDDAIGEYGAKNRVFKEVEPEYERRTDGIVRLKMWAKLDMCMPSKARIENICQKIKKNLEKKYYYDVDVWVDEYSIEAMKNYEPW